MQRFAKVVLMSLVIGACGDSDIPGTPIDPLEPASMTVTLSSAAAMTSAGDTRALTAVVKNASGDVLNSPRVEWTSSSPAIASLSNTNVDTVSVTAIDDGTATITAKLGSLTQSVSVTVTRKLATVELTAPSDMLEWGFSMQVEPKAFDARHNVIASATGFTFESNNPVTLVVSPTGLVTTLFQFPQNTSGIISAKLTRDGVTAQGHAEVTAVAPVTFTHAALLLTDYVLPSGLPFRGAGIAFLTARPGRILYKLNWSDLTGPATRVQLRGPANAQETGEVIAELATPVGPNTYGIVTGLISAQEIRAQGGRPPISTDSLERLICNRQAYLEVQTARHPNGEMRGQVFCR